jgi:hypothetical protein
MARRSSAFGDGRLVSLGCLLGSLLLLAGSVFGVDFLGLALGMRFAYPMLGKPGITVLAASIALLALGRNLGRGDYALLLAAFACMVPTDILMSVVVLDPALSVGGLTFMIGGLLSIVADLFLIIRHCDRFRFLKGFRARELWLPLVIYGSTAAILVLLWPGIVRVGHAVIAPVYTAFFCTLAWVCWEGVRRRTYPRPNAIFAAAAATCWFATEIVGEIYNLGLGPASDVALRVVWLFYAPNVALWALSAFDWSALRAGSSRFGRGGDEPQDLDTAI